ncbi:peptidylprolyl isomerase [Sedimentitalea sp. HM32M-2]|uniref:peptidylprolyl isomerase n=1 Tax=Sedimentitalea sp. HM32M-2 TaxID=3351566 RepID=UPI0036D41C02
MQLTLMRKLRPHLRRLTGGALGLLLTMLAGSAIAQGLFAPVIMVNDQVITRFELEQRALFLQLLRAPGNPRQLAREALIEDRLKLQAVKAAGMSISPEDVEAGIEELAARTELSAEEFIAALKQSGVALQTLQDFAKVNVAWRDLIRARFLSQARPTEAEIDRALGSAGGGSGIRVLLSEIIIPVTPQTAEQVDALAQEIAQLTSQQAFSQAATQYSAAQTRNSGGRMNWLDLNALPPGLRPVILALSPGEITDPIALPEAVALFQMRGIQESNIAAPRYSAIEYATYAIPGGRSPEALAEAARIGAAVDSCDDLYGIALNQPPERLVRESRKPGEIPRDIATELAKLDENESSTALTRANGQTLLYLMLCGRTAALNEDASRADVANALVSQRLQAFAQSYLDQLQADAVIVEK